jgi:DNA-binding MarR family transcriptional regulator
MIEYLGDRDTGMIEAPSNGSTTDRELLLMQLMRAIRIGSAQGVLHSHLIADRLGINSSDLESLDLLQFHGSLSAGRLAELTGLTTGAITGLVDRLERAGFVRRTKDPRDRRRVIIELNREQAEPKIMPYFEPLSDAMVEFMQRFGDAELETLLEFAEGAAVAMQQAIDRLRDLPPS